EDPFRWRQDLHPARTRSRPPAVVRGHAADGDEPIDLFSEDGGETVDHAGAAAAVVDVVAGDDKEKFLAVRIGLTGGVHAADHLANLFLQGGEWHRRRVVHR